MSVVSKNPFDLLDDGEERAPSPAPKAGAAKATPAPASAQPKVVPGAAPKGGRGARYPARGGPRNVYREERPAEGGEGFEGERVAPPKKDHQGRDRHTKGPREDRTHTGPRSRAPGAAGARGPKGGARGGRTGGAAGAQGDKKPAAAESWNNDEGKAELSAEKQGETDGVEAAAAPAEEAVEEVVEEEDTSKTLDQYLAEKAENALSGDLGKKEVRQVTADNLEGTAFKREEDEDFFSGKAKTSAPKEKAPKKEKVYIEVDGTFAAPARPPRTGGDRPQRGRGAGGARGGQRGSGPRGGAAPRGGASRAPRQQAVSVNDTSAFPALGA
ncbi:hypothetical protein VHUM_00439 [Vanrija humicola]|uniref:Hyaluronan/mRNA-binding protein domain-containing protein n=1 Tax=Vanrija humicola TaxID=5417 RepID=A0A7D8V616_VANHU|nr:hypothetical protein VHUM_00439 [Vanrija humicola]